MVEVVMGHIDNTIKAKVSVIIANLTDKAD